MMTHAASDRFAETTERESVLARLIQIVMRSTGSVTASVVSTAGLSAVAPPTSLRSQLELAKHVAAATASRRSLRLTAHPTRGRASHETGGATSRYALCPEATP